MLNFSLPGSLMVHRASLTDGWLLGALGMVGTRPELLKEVFLHSEPLVGLHALRFFKDGAWVSIVVDDLIPSHGKLKPVYSSNSEPRDGPVRCMRWDGDGDTDTGWGYGVGVEVRVRECGWGWGWR